MDRFKISQLRSYYGSLLTDRQNEYLKLHYDEDLSLGEIADIYEVSRQAILDAINKGEKLLAEYEEKLNLVKRDETIKEILSSIDTKDESVKESIKKVIEILED